MRFLFICQTFDWYCHSEYTASVEKAFVSDECSLLWSFGVIELVLPLHCYNHSQLAEGNQTSERKNWAMPTVERRNVQPNLNRRKWLGRKRIDASGVCFAVFFFFSLKYLIYERVYEMIFNWFIAEHFPLDKFSLHFDPIKRQHAGLLRLLLLSVAVRECESTPTRSPVWCRFNNLPYFRHFGLIQLQRIHLIYFIGCFYE